MARAIHGLSGRAEGPFVSINCGALPDTLLESELFGHVKGAFTDARQSKKGLFEAAHGGTLFLDEVGETSLAMQVKLLRALQERRIRRVGGTDETEVDVRVIAATNAPLEELVKQKRFREDLFYRLQVIPIHTPPLRERREDIPLLAEHFTARFAQQMGKRVAKVSEEAMALLQAYSWPGNVRQLENVIERAVALETTEAVLPERLPDGDPAAGAVGAAAGDRRRLQPRRVPAVGRGAAPRRGARALGRRSDRGGAPARDLVPIAPLPGPEARPGATGNGRVTKIVAGTTGGWHVGRC